MRRTTWSFGVGQQYRLREHWDGTTSACIFGTHGLQEHGPAAFADARRLADQIEAIERT